MGNTQSCTNRVVCLILALIIVTTRAAGGNDAETDRDEEIYGKFAIGPKTPTPLDAAVAALNLKLAEFVATYDRQSTQRKLADTPGFKPLMAQDVVTAINNWDRAKRPVADATYRLYAEIAKTRTLPPHSLFEINDQWFQRGKEEVRTCQITLTAMTGKNQGDSFVIREKELDTRPCPRPGYHWLNSLQQKDPEHGWIGWLDGSVKISFDETEPQALVVNVNRPFDVIGLQVVAIDEQGQRYDLDCRAMGAYEGFLADQFRLDPRVMSREMVKFIGVEVVSSNARKAHSLSAAQRRQNQRVVMLPAPLVGQRYEFSIVVDGTPIESRQLRGKVVLIDLWGSWCQPCLKKMPKLKEMFANLHEKGLEIIGISFDDDVEQAQAVIDRLALPWPSVNLQPDSEARERWTKAIPLTHLPTVLLLDRSGVLRYQLVGSAENYEAKIADLLSESAGNDKSKK